jgi:hypothetical protein
MGLAPRWLLQAWCMMYIGLGAVILIVIIVVIVLMLRR